MAPKKRKGKNKHKKKANEHMVGVDSTDIFDIVLSELGTTYTASMADVQAAVRRILIKQAPGRMGKTRLRRVHTKHYTPKEGTFQIRIMPSRDSLPEEHLHLRLLFRWSDLYYLGYHSRDKWYIFEDEVGVVLPPKEKLFFTEIVDLPFDSSYDSLGGPPIFRKFYTTMMQSHLSTEANELKQHLLRCCMALPVVAFGEALRFVLLLNWVSDQVALEEDNAGETVPIEYSAHFNSWGTDSEVMFATNQPPADLVSRLGILKTPSDAIIPIIRRPHEQGSPSSEEE